VTANTTVTGGDRKITVSGGAVTGATGYELYHSTSTVAPNITTGIATAVISGGATTTADITGLSGGTTYYVWVRAVNNGGKTAWVGGSAKNATTTAGLTITMVLDKTVTAAPTATAIYKNFGTSSLTVTSSGFTSYTWLVDGVDRGNGNSITINAANYELGYHQVTLIAYDGSGYYSQELSFAVNQ
jgi:hypothetical protein